MSHPVLSHVPPAILALACLAGFSGRPDGHGAPERPMVSSEAPGDRSRESGLPSKASGQSLDLLGLIDLERDRLSGSWSFEEGGLWMGGGHRSKLALPIAPHVSYEIHMDFTMKAGYQFGILLPLNPGVTLAWVTAAHKGGKDTIDLGRYHDAAPYVVKKTPSRRLVGCRKCMVIRVETKAGEAHVSVVLEDEKVLEWKGPKTSLTVNRMYAMPNDPLGLTNWGTTVLIHELDLRTLPAATRDK